MFNNKGESKMFLIIERIEYSNIDHSFSIVQNTDNKSKAEGYKKALETLHADDDNKKSFSIVEVA